MATVKKGKGAATLGVGVAMAFWSHWWQGLHAQVPRFKGVLLLGSKLDRRKTQPNSIVAQLDFSDKHVLK